jgi:hypothetical protein
MRFMLAWCGAVWRCGKAVVESYLWECRLPALVALMQITFKRPKTKQDYWSE